MNLQGGPCGSDAFALTRSIEPSAASAAAAAPESRLRSRGDFTCRSRSSGPASPAWATPWLLHRQGFAVTLFEANDYARWPHPHRRRHARRHHASGGHRLPGLQRPHLSAPVRAVRRARRRVGAQHDVVRVRDDAARLEWAGSDLAIAVRAAAQPRCGPRSGACSRTSCASTATHDGAAAAGRACRRARSASTSTRERYGDAHSATGTCCRWPASIWSSPRRELLDFPLPSFVALLPQPRPAADPRPAAMADGQRRCAHLRRAHRGDAARRAPVDAGHARAPPARVGVEVDRAGGAAERFDGVVLACHSDQALALLGDDASLGERRALARIRYQPNRVAAAHRHGAAAAPAARVVGVELPRHRRPRRSVARSRCSY